MTYNFEIDIESLVGQSDSRLTGLFYLYVWKWSNYNSF